MHTFHFRLQHIPIINRVCKTPTKQHQKAKTQHGLFGSPKNKKWLLSRTSLSTTSRYHAIMRSVSTSHNFTISLDKFSPITVDSFSTITATDVQQYKIKKSPLLLYSSAASLTLEKLQAHTMLNRPILIQKSYNRIHNPSSPLATLLQQQLVTPLHGTSPLSANYERQTNTHILNSPASYVEKKKCPILYINYLTTRNANITILVHPYIRISTRIKITLS